VDYHTLDDEALIRLILHARPEALSELYDRYNRLVFSMAWHAVGDRETAEEITQDVFFRIWEKAATYRAEQARVSTWLASITRYRAIDVLRQRGVRAEQYSLAWDDVPAHAEPQGAEDPAEMAELSMQQARVRQAVQTLPGDQRQALALAFFQGLSHSQIAARLGEPLGTVKTRIRLGMQKLREVLRDDLPVNR
jgi:RNA polymerase sigma-70 factor (ECF subfamily)